ncbi:hypothetical protein KKC88_02900 [Patescibacteria group bacterium]|nr:hypothetical protein [Patescibacteria group bacterium]MBU1673820.1 hypothetical protein [Patescibacteria group bacterium]MBU1964067.1 hypothetical protein [Patescibacteria group bacterium]
MTLKDQDKKQNLSPLEKIRGPLPQLQEGDLVLVQKKGSLIKYLVRRVTGGYWDHAALVLLPKNPKKGYFHNIVIESVPGGVEVHKLSKYLENPKKFDIGIKRFPNLSEEMKTRVKASMLMNIDAPHQRLKVSKFGFALASKSYSGKMLSRQRFSTSGLIQKAFYEAASWEGREGIIFRDKFASPLELEDSTTPQDIAICTKCKWIYNKHEA